MSSGCLACGRFLHDECEFDPCCCRNTPTIAEQFNLNTDNPYEKAFYKKDEDVTDPKSTGRKRAAQLYPINREDACEWRGLKRVGGGTNPIIGCLQGKQTHRHHGPDKNTLNNSERNVHRICNDCHNRWHNANDWCINNTLPHDPQSATQEEIIKNELDWASGKFSEYTNRRKDFFKKNKEVEHDD